jgi:general secretion pathway protein N
VLSKAYRLPLLLALLCCIAAAALTLQWFYVKKHEQQVKQQLKKPLTSKLVLADPPEDNLLLEEEIKFEEMTTRPLFLKSRKPLPEKLVDSALIEAAPPQPVTELAAKFSGFIDVPSGKIALIKDIKTRKYHRLQKGEQVNDWTLTELYPDRVVFKQGEATEELLLRVPKVNKKNPKTGRAHTAVRRPATPTPKNMKPQAAARRKKMMGRAKHGKNTNIPDPNDLSCW